MRRPDYNRRIVVTGLGTVSPIGNDVDTVWNNLVAGCSGLGPITRFDASGYESNVAGELKGFEARDWMDFKAARRTGLNVQFGVAAAKQALADSGIEVTTANRDEIGIIFASGAGEPKLMMDNKETWDTKGARLVSPFFIANMLVDTASGQIAIETGIRGHNMAVVTACSTGTHSIGEAAEAIRRGDCTAIIAGSTESPIYEMVWIGFGNMRGIGTPRPGEPLQTVSRPFDLTRNGFILGEGAAALMLEDLELAQARGARIYAEVVGYGSTNDAWDLIQPIEGGDGVARAMQMALDRRGVPADEIDMINPHGTSTPLGDLAEAQAIHRVFGERGGSIAISATKSMTGHMMGAAGSFEGLATVLSVFHQVVPPTVNYRDPDPEIGLDVSPVARPMPIRYAMSDNVGLGGHNGAVIFKRYDGD
ncbi:MAG: beta-ketoacyl-[acyl-carrier-protein] synthase family protein [Candidatus Limnocylindrales bacterium]|jgi:beta-ketoacyl-acyl-carrier-protein synthase II